MASATVPPALGAFLPDTPGVDELLDAFIEWSARSGLELYPHQEEAVLRLLAGDSVVLATPTGSGKSLVALAGAFTMLAQGRRATYTAPTKALVSEKFFELTAAFGASNVGMVTGDASVNGDAPVIACTAEILAQRALRSGAVTPADLVVMDEFHYYGDRDRGWAWQVPLLELTGAQFLLMSATLGDTSTLRRDLSDRTGRETALVASTERPVPLDVEYRETPLHVSIEQLRQVGPHPRLHRALHPEGGHGPGPEPHQPQRAQHRSEGRSQGGGGRISLRHAHRQGPAPLRAGRHRRAPRRDAAQVPAARSRSWPSRAT